MKRLWLILVLLSALWASYAFGITVYHMATGGVVECKDGVWQNSKVYFENIYYEDGKVFYTVVNDTYRRVPTGYAPYTQRLENGEWKHHALYREYLEPRVWVPPFSRSTSSFTVSGASAKADIVGEYRIYFGRLSDTAPSIVGYLTITDEMVKDCGLEGELFFTDGIRQNTMLTLDTIRYVDHSFVYTVTNRTGIKQYGGHVPMIEKREGEAWQPCQELAFESDMTWSIEDGESAEAWFNIVKRPPAELVGEYRFVFGCYLMEEDYKTNTRTMTRIDRMDYIVAYVTLTEDML